MNATCGIDATLSGDRTVCVIVTHKRIETRMIQPRSGLNSISMLPGLLRWSNPGLDDINPVGIGFAGAVWWAKWFGDARSIVAVG